MRKTVHLFLTTGLLQTMNELHRVRNIAIGFPFSYIYLRPVHLGPMHRSPLALNAVGLSITGQTYGDACYQLTGISVDKSFLIVSIFSSTKFEYKPLLKGKKVLTTWINYYLVRLSKYAKKFHTILRKATLLLD